MEPQKPPVAYYDAQYKHLISSVNAEVRAETFGTDLGQSGWITADEQDLFIGWLALAPGQLLVDVASGSGGPLLRIAQVTGATACGIDLHEQGLAQGTAAAERAGLADRVTFRRADANEPLPLADGSVDAITCIDAINHLRDRRATFADWARLLRPGGRLVFTDPIIITGAVSNEEIAIRSSIGFYLYTPRDLDERLLGEAGFEVRATADRTENMAATARRWHAARERHAEALRELEGAQTFEGQQRFFDVTARLAEERRLSRVAFHTVRR